MNADNRHLKIVQFLVKEIENNIGEQLNISKLASSVNLSTWHLQRLFKSLLGESLGNYIKGRKHTYAAKLLKETEQSIIDIAYSVGFNSHEAFSRSFKVYYESTPIEFRKSGPKVQLKKKPILSSELLNHLLNEVVQSPIIVELQHNELVGRKTIVPSPLLGSNGYNAHLFPFWMSFLKELNKESSLNPPEQFFGIIGSESGDFVEESIDYIAAVPTFEKENSLTETINVAIPKSLYAAFTVTGKCDSIDKTVDFIYGLWLSNSKYKRGKGSDFVIFDSHFDFRKPDSKIKYYVPIIPI